MGIFEQYNDVDNLYTSAFFANKYATHCVEIEPIDDYILNLTISYKIVKFLVIRERYLMLQEIIKRCSGMSKEDAEAIQQFEKNMTKINELHKPYHFLFWLARTDPKAPVNADIRLEPHVFDQIIASAELQEKKIVAILEKSFTSDIVRAAKDYKEDKRLCELNMNICAIMQTLAAIVDTQTKISNNTKGANGLSFLLSRMRANESEIAKIMEGNAKYFENITEYSDLQSQNTALKDRFALIYLELDLLKQELSSSVKKFFETYSGFIGDLLGQYVD